MLTKLQLKGIINILGGLFLFSCYKEIDSLIVRGIFKLINKDAKELKGVKIFSSRIVNKIKEKDTSTLYKKLR